EVFFLQKNYQASANAYRDCLNGDGDPRWTEVWSHIQLGKIFDITGQRERATNIARRYRLTTIRRALSMKLGDICRRHTNRRRAGRRAVRCNFDNSSTQGCGCLGAHAPLFLPMEKHTYTSMTRCSRRRM